MVKLMTMLNIKGGLDIMSTSTISNRRVKGDGLIRERIDGRFEYGMLRVVSPMERLYINLSMVKAKKSLSAKLRNIMRTGLNIL